MDVAGRKARVNQAGNAKRPSPHSTSVSRLPRLCRTPCRARALCRRRAGRARVLQELQRTVDPEFIVREGMTPWARAHEPPAVGIVGGELGRHPELAQGGRSNDGAPAGESRLQPLDYLMPIISIHALKIARNPISPRATQNVQRK